MSTFFRGLIIAVCLIYIPSYLFGRYVMIKIFTSTVPLRSFDYYVVLPIFGAIAIAFTIFIGVVLYYGIMELGKLSRKKGM